MALFKDTPHFAEHYPALLTVDWDRLVMSVELVELKVLRNVVLGPTLYDALHAAYVASIAPGGTALSGNMLNLHTKCLKPLAFLSAYEAIPDLSALWTSAGLRQSIGPEETAAPMWMSNQARDSALSKGHAWLDELIAFLVKNKSTYTDWAASPMKQEVEESLITTLVTVDRHARILGSAWLLHQLRPALRTIQNGVLSNTMGAARLAQLVAKVHGTDPLDADDKLLLDLARPAMLYGAIAEEAVNMRINVDRTGVYTLEGSTGSNNMTRVEKGANADQMNALVRNCQGKCNGFLDQIREVMRPSSSINPSLGGTGSVFRS